MFMKKFLQNDVEISDHQKRWWTIAHEKSIKLRVYLLRGRLTLTMGCSGRHGQLALYLKA